MAVHHVDSLLAQIATQGQQPREVPGRLTAELQHRDLGGELALQLAGAPRHDHVHAESCLVHEVRQVDGHPLGPTDAQGIDHVGYANRLLVTSHLIRHPSTG